MKKQRVLVVLHSSLVPPDSLEGHTEKEIAEWRTEYDVISTLKARGHEVLCVGVLDSLTELRTSIADWKPDVVFNLLEEFDGIGTYDQQYPSNHNAFGLVDLFGFENIKQVRGNLDLKPAANLSLLFQAGSLHVTTVRDSVYNGSGSAVVKAPAAGFASDGIGTEFDASAKYLLRKYVLVNAGVGHFFPGGVMTHGAKGAPLTLVYFGLTYRFRIN